MKLTRPVSRKIFIYGATSAIITLAVICINARRVELVDARFRVLCRGHLKHVASALHHYRDDYGIFPGDLVSSQTGEPLLSWRITLLKYAGPGDKELFQEFRLNEPWDSPHNKELIPRMPFWMACPADVQGEFLTNYFYATKHPALRGNPAANPALEDNLLLIESSSAEPWTKPTSKFAWKKERSSLHRGTLVVSTDGRAHVIQTED